MKKIISTIVGIDVSKKTFDIAIGENDPDPKIVSNAFSNNLKGFDELESWMGKNNFRFTDCLICLENTGIYHRLLANYLLSKGALVWVESAVQIKWSMGIQRGKSDIEDARRIMTYAYRNQDKTKAYSQRDKSIQQVSDYLSLRSRLQNCIQSLKVPIRELRSVGLKDEAKVLERSSKKSIGSMVKEIAFIDQEIKKVIQQNEDLSKKYKLATSVKSIGPVAGIALLVYTNGFTKFNSSKQIASYAGIAPFEHSSGTSIRGRTRVHPMGNKTLKTILHMCAISSLRNNPEMKAYYKRKVGDGKNKMLVINAIRNKLLARVFSCVKRQEMYVSSYAA